MLSRRRFLGSASVVAIAAATPASARFLHGSGSGAAPSFDATLTVRPTERNWIDVSTAVTANVPAGNKITTKLETLSGSADGFSLRVWQYPSHAPGAGNAYAYTKREIGKYNTIDTSGSPTGSGKAWVTFSYKNGANETGSTVNYVVGLNVSAVGKTTWAYGAKSLARCGGPLLSEIGAGTATSITNIKDHLGATLSTLPFEVFYGRMVWAATDGTSTTYGSTRAVSTATALTQSPYTVTFNNGDVLTVTAVGGQWDVAPAPAAVITAMGTNSNQYVITGYLAQFALNDVIMFEDGLHNPTNIAVTNVHAYLPTGLNSGTMPQAPAAGSIIDVEQSGWIKHTSRTPWGATIQGYAWAFGTPDITGTANTSSAGVACFRFTNMITVDGFHPVSQAASYSNSQGCYSWFQVDHCYQDVSSQQTRHGLASGSPSFFQSGPSTSNGGRGRLFLHDNWTLGSDIAIECIGYDVEVVGNRIETVSEDCIRWGGWNSTSGSKASKCWFNFMLGKWWGNSSHPDYMQIIIVESSDPELAAAFPVSGTVTNPATFTSTVELGTIIGNVGIPDASQNYNTDISLNNGQGPGFVPTNNGTLYQLEDGEGLLGGDFADGRYYTFAYAGNIVVSTMSNGFYVRNAGTNSRFVYNTMLQDYYAFATGRAQQPGLGGPGVVYNEYTADTGKANNNFMPSMSAANWANCKVGSAPIPAQANNNTTTYDGTAIAGVMVNGNQNWGAVTKLQQVLDSCVTSGAEATRGAMADLTKINIRERTWSTSILA
jgi:hypothetical protein